MKKSIFILLAAIVGLLSSCNQMSERKYNDTVANMYKSFATTLATRMSGMSGNESKDVILANLKSLDKTTDSCIGVMNSLKPSEDAKDFHQKVVAMFQLIKTDFLPAAEKLTNVKGSEDVEAYNSAVSQMNEATSKITTQEAATQAAQRAYAGKVGMKIQ